jgi:hypothetical protein
MARRLRVGPASSPKTLGVVAAAVLVVVLVVTGRALNPGSVVPPAVSSSAHSATASSHAPYRLGGAVDCPSAWPVLAMSNHASYPGRPPRPAASRCDRGRLL